MFLPFSNTLIMRVSFGIEYFILLTNADREKERERGINVKFKGGSLPWKWNYGSRFRNESAVEREKIIPV